MLKIQGKERDGRPKGGSQALIKAMRAKKKGKKKDEAGGDVIKYKSFCLNIRGEEEEGEGETRPEVKLQNYLGMKSKRGNELHLRAGKKRSKKRRKKRGIKKQEILFFFM